MCVCAAEYLSNQKAGCHSVSVHLLLMLLYMTDLQTVRVRAGTAAVVREAVSGGKCLGKYSQDSVESSCKKYILLNCFLLYIIQSHNVATSTVILKLLCVFPDLQKRCAERTCMSTIAHARQNLPLPYSSSSVLMADKIVL